MNTTPNEV